MSDEPRAMTQDEIDALFASISGSAPAVPKAQRTESIPHPETPPAAAAEAPAQPAPESAAPSPDTTSASKTERSPVSQATPAAEAADDGPMGQDAIDAMLAEMEGNDSPAPAAAATPPPSTAAAKPASGAAGLGQDDIDALLAEMNGDDEKSAGEGPLGQDDIDSLLAELDGSVAPVSESVSRSGETSRLSETKRVNSDLSQEEIDNIAARHDGDSQEDSEALIDQNDIDALVRQMSEATSAPNKDRITEILNRRENDIEALLNEAAKSVQTEDAVSELVSYDAASSPSMGWAPPSDAMAPEELRGSRFMLAAAVFLLAMCTAAMVFVVFSVNRLSGELAANREAVITPTDDFNEDLRIAREILADADPVTAEKGVQLLKRVRRRHRDVSREIEVTLLLARHFLAQGNAKNAVTEYATVAERHGTLVDDPNFYLEWASAHDALRETDEARRVVGILLANEHRYLRGRDGSPLDEETYRRNQRVLRQGYLLLGRLDMRSAGDDSLASRTNASVGNGEALP